MRQHRRAIRTEGVAEHTRIFAGADAPFQPRGPQGREQREFVMVDAHQHRNPCRPVGGESRNRVVWQRRRSGHRAGECVGVSEEVVPRRTLEAGRRHRAQTPRGGGRVTAARCDRVVHAPLLRQLHIGLRLARRALNDRRAEQSYRPRRDQVIAHRHSAGGFAGDGDLLRVTAECGDVVTDPAQRGLLVGQAVVADRAGRTERRVSQETQRTQPVVDRDDHDVASGRQPARVVNVAAAVDEPAAVDPHHHRTFLAVLSAGRSPDVECQAVFAGGFAHARLETGVLHALRPGLGGVQHARPARRRPRHLPSQWSHRRRGIRNVLEHRVIRGDLASYRPHRGAYDAGVQRSRIGRFGLARLDDRVLPARRYEQDRHQQDGPRSSATERSVRHGITAYGLPESSRRIIRYRGERV